MLRALNKSALVKQVPWKGEELHLVKNGHCLNCHKSKNLVLPARYFSEICPPPPPAPKRGLGFGTKLLLGTALVGGGTLGYAKYDPGFRKLLEDNVPYSETVLKYAYLEENPFQFISDFYTVTKESLLGSSSDELTGPIPPPKEYKAPPPISPSLEKPSKAPQCYTEIRVETKEDGKEEPSVIIGGDVKPSEETGAGSLDIEDLERKICENATEAVNAYNRALYNLRKYNRELCHILDEAVDKIKPEVWDSIKERSRNKTDCMQKAEERADQASKSITELKCLISGSDFKAPQATKDAVRASIARVQEDIQKAKQELETEKKSGAITEKYWDKVQAARKHFAYELETLFPDIDLSKKQLALSQDELDLFILHTYAHVLFYQKELAKIETVIHDKIQHAVVAARHNNFEVLSDSQICEAIQQEKRKLASLFQQQALKLRRDADCEAREKLKNQSQAFSDHLKDAIDIRAKEIERDLTRMFDEKLETEKCRFKYQLATMIGRLKGLDHAIKSKAEADASSKQAQVLWSACQALIRSLRAGCPGQSWRDQMKPLNAEIKAVKKAAAENDELVNVVITGIPKEAQERGVYPEDALKERFLQVEKVARSVALIPEGGATLPVHILSYIQSVLLVKAASPIPQAELEDCEVDVSKLDTNDVLQRARYWVDRGNYEQSLKYMNLLKGAPRVVAKEWMNETRILLETQQAANTLMAYAASSGLMYL